MITFTEFCSELLAKHGYLDFEYDIVISFTQTFSNTTCGLGGIGGQAFTNAQIFAFITCNTVIIIGPAWSYCIEDYTEMLSVDIYNHHIANMCNIARINQYGNIKKIKRI